MFFRKRNRRKKITTYGEFLTLFPCCKESHQEYLLKKLWKAQRPNFLHDKEVPENFNTITYGQLDDLSRARNSEDPAIKSIEIIMGMSVAEIYSLNVFDVFGFANFCLSELTRINKLFQTIKPSHSSEEIAAGINDLNFGTFGVVDWYAKRMGITNQDEVYKVAWIRIFTCMKNDNATNEYESRLHKQYMESAKRKK